MLWSFGYFGPQLWWATYPANSWVPWIALVLLESILLWLTLAVWKLVDSYLLELTAKHPGWVTAVRILWLPAAWVAGEVLRSSFPFSGLPWSNIAFSQVSGPLLHMAGWLGAGGVAGEMVFLVALVLFIDYRPPLPRGMRLPIKIFPILIGSAVVLLGAIIPSPTVEKIGTINVAAVQGNVPGRGINAFGRPYQVLENHAHLTVQAKHPDIVIWPENSADVYPGSDQKAAETIVLAAHQVKAPIFFGAVRPVPKPGQVPDTYNEMLIANDFDIKVLYAKQHPVPFGEYLPWRGFIERVFPPARSIRMNMLPGGKSALVQLPTASGKTFLAASPICFEIADNWVLRDSAPESNLLIVPTSNTMFGGSNEPPQQLAITKFRAVEFGRDAVQVSTMGLSGKVDRFGKTSFESKLYEAKLLEFPVNLYRGRTPAAAVGKGVEYGSVLFTIITTIWVIIKGRKRGKNG